MHPTPSRQFPGDPGALVGGVVVGAGLAMTGICFALLAVSTPFATRIAGNDGRGSTTDLIAMAAWTLAIIAGGCLVIAGTHRLAAILAAVRWRSRRRSPVIAALADSKMNVDVAVDVAPQGGQPIPEVLIGPFGVAVVRELGRDGALRRVGTSWEVRTADGWVPAEHPLDRAARDADRIRHWLNHGDLDFVVRVYAAVVSADPTIPRSPLCAVISEAQIPDWIAALPPQRSLTPARRDRLSVQVNAASIDRRRHTGRVRADGAAW